MSSSSPSTIDKLTRRNQAFVASEFHILPAIPSLGTLVISCADPRVDPAHVLGLQHGEAVVIRNIGGRITPATLQNIGLLQLVGQRQPVNPDGRAADGL